MPSGNKVNSFNAVVGVQVGDQLSGEELTEEVRKMVFEVELKIPGDGS
jgi:hypothetical protein